MASLAFPRDGAAIEARSLPQPLPIHNRDRANVFVVPAYNEADNLPRLLVDLESRLELFPEGSRVIVVDDGSTDSTPDLVSAYDGPLVVELVRLDRNQGPGAAFRAGFAVALERCGEEDLVITLEADTTCDLDSLPEMLRRVEDGAELVLASVHGGGRMLNVSWTRRMLSAGAGVVIRWALGLDARTVSSFFRVYQAPLLRKGLRHYGADFIREPGFACMAEVLAKFTHLGARIDEVPVDLDATRRVGDSKMPVARTLAAYWRLIVRGQPGRDGAREGAAA